MIYRTLLSLSLVLTLFFFVCRPVAAEEINFVKSIQQMVGEDYLYAIDFLVFTKLAAGELRLSKTAQPNVYRAELVGRTLGVAARLTGKRTQTYTSLMELTPDGSLRSIEHVANIVKLRLGTWQKRGRHHRYDYVQGKVVDEKTKEGLLRSRKEFTFPSDQCPVDMLTAFYNLRAGVYGPLVPGAHFLIPTYSDHGFTKMEINILTHDQQSRFKKFPMQGLVVQAKIDPQIFDNDSGIIYIWFNKAGVPERGILEDMIGVGDIVGYLDKEGL